MIFMYILISTLINLSEIIKYVSPYYNDISAVSDTLAALVILVSFVAFIFRILFKTFPNKTSTAKNSEILIEYEYYFTEKELEKFNIPFVQRIENNVERDVIKETFEFLMGSEQVLIISGESGVGKTRLAIEVSKKINENSKLLEGFKFKGKCLFVNLRRYQDSKDIEEKLNDKLSEKIVLIFDDYQYNTDLFKEIKNNALKWNSKLIITTRPIFVETLKDKIGVASFRELKMGRMDIKGILQYIEDKNMAGEIEKVSEGNPAIALFALNYLKEHPGGNTKKIFQGVRTRKEFFDKIIKDFEKEYGKDFIEYLAGRELIGGVIDIPQKYEKILINMERSEHIVKTESKYHLTPDVLSEYLINREFFTSTILKHSFEQLAKEDNGTYIPEMLNSIMKIKDGRDIFREAAEKLLVISNQLESDAGQKRRRIQTGIMVYDGFGSLNLVTSRLGEFWKDYGTLEDGNDLCDLGIFLEKISRPYEARKCLEKAKEIFTKSHDNIGISIVIHNLGISFQNQGNFDEAINLYNQSLKIKKELRDKSGIAITLYQLGMIHQYQGKYQEAVNLYNQSLKIAKEQEDKSEISRVLHQLGNICKFQGKYQEALNLYNQSLRIEEEIGDIKGISSTLYQLGEIHRLQGNYQEAIKLLNYSMEIVEELGNKRGIAASLEQLGINHMEQGNYQEAKKMCNKSLKIKEDLGDKYGIARTLHKIGMIYQEECNYQEAVNLFHQSLKIKGELGDRTGIIDTLRQLGMIHEAKKEFFFALQDYQEAFSISKELKSPHSKLISEFILRLREKMGDEQFKNAYKELDRPPIDNLNLSDPHK
jgi:tetratricopeptide (TPR) repeat protein